MNKMIVNEDGATVDFTQTWGPFDFGVGRLIVRTAKGKQLQVEIEPQQVVALRDIFAKCAARDIKAGRATDTQ
jgi:hypothetical protein